ncbi:NAD-dependent DNA ligase LigA (plasmid) [Citricoccus nitrophenolicus]
MEQDTKTPAQITSHREYTVAVAEASFAAQAYYDGQTPTMTDAAWDQLVERIAAYELANDITAEHQLHTAVAAGVSKGGDIEHPVPMLSLDKIKYDQPEALDAFITRYQNDRLVVEPKLDGLAARLVYRGGKLVQIVTRGDGRTGEDVTERVLPTLRDIPNRLASAMDFEVRGELYLDTEGLTKANAIRAEHGKAEFANARNGAAGIVARQDGRYAGTLSFAPYFAVGSGDLFTSGSHTADMQELRVMGFTPALHLVGLPQDPRTAIDRLAEFRPDLPFLIDGAVVKVDSEDRQRELGEGSRAPKWAVAYKYPALETQSVVRAIELTIGKTGRLGLRALIDPVEVDGSTVSYASVHNVRWLLEQDIRVGDIVVVSKANDVIPRVESPFVHLRPEDSVAWVPPTGCPQCGEPFNKDTELWRCETPDCSVAGRLRYAVSRDAGFDIEGLGGNIIDALVDEGLLYDAADLFDLTEDAIANAPLGQTKTGGLRYVGATNARKIMAEIDKAKDAPLNRVITALSIRMVGRTMGRRLAKAYPYLPDLQEVTVNQLAAVEGIGSVKAQVIFDGLQSNRHIIERLAAAGVNMGSPVDTSTGGVAKALSGMTVCVTGSMKGSVLGELGRSQMQELIEAHGGTASGSVSAKTDILVAGEAAGSKFEKASKLGKTILSPTEFAEFLGL